MSKKNNKGYFLVETIIVLTIVSTIITTLYVNSMNNYIKEKNELTKYNTVDGLYSANAIKKYLFIYEDELIKEVADKGYVNVNNFFSKKNMNINDIDLFLVNFELTKNIDTPNITDKAHVVIYIPLNPPTAYIK